jgi:general secretion pathway protein C
MRGSFGLYRIFWVANSVLLVIFGYVLVSLILAQEPWEEAPADPQDEAAETDTSPGDKPSAPGDPRIILGRNIFGPAGVLTAERGLKKDKPAPQPVVRKPMELRLLGTVEGTEEVACAVIEDMKTKVQDLYVTGDVIRDARIDRIERSRIVLLRGGVQEILNLYVASESSVASGEDAGSRVAEDPGVAEAVKVISPTKRAINKSAFLAKIGGMEAVLKTVKASPYLVNGQAKGLRITGLEGLSMARYVGLENGDVIQTINGQTVTDKRKAFQVLRKARALASSDIQLLRGREEKTLSLRVE